MKSVIRLSRDALKLWRLLTERPARYSMTEIRRDLQMSKTRLYGALAELEDAGLVRMED